MRVDRREVLAGAAGALLGGLMRPRSSSALQRGSPAPGTVLALTDRLSLLTSGGTNVLALSAPGALVMVDSGAPELVDSLMTSVRLLTADGIATVFNTHYHAQNTGANDVLRRAGAAIAAHENTRIWMATPVWMPAEDRYRPPRPEGAHPTRTFYTDGAIEGGNEHIEYGHLIEAHTSGDVYVFFRTSNVLAVGDVASPARDPELDYFTGAWLGGRVDALNRLVALCDGNTRIVPGYGPVMNRADLQAERDTMRTIYDRVVDRVRKGDYVEDMLQAGVLDGVGRTWMAPRKFLYDVHKGLWAHHNKLAPDVV